MIRSRVSANALGGDSRLVSQEKAPRTYTVYLVHDGLECRETSGQDQASKRQSRFAVIPHREQMGGGIRTSDNNHIIASRVIPIIAVIVTVGIVQRRRGLDIGIQGLLLGKLIAGANGDDLLLVDGFMTRHLDDLAFDRIDRGRDNDVVAQTHLDCPSRAGSGPESGLSGR